jgi:DNA-binding NarL/FixJ family response regulator
MVRNAMPGASAARQIRDSDVRAMLGFVSELTSFEHPEDFREGMLPGLRELVPCEIVSYNEVEFAAGKMIALDDPPGSMIPDAPEIFIRLGHQNPLVSRYQRTRDGRPYKWSDLITRRELHATDLYREAYAPMAVEYQMAFCLPAPPEVIIGLALNRGRRDFSERDRGLLNLVRGPMIQAYRTVQRYAAVVQRLNAFERGLERSGAGVVVLEETEDGAVGAFVSAEAARLLGIGGPDSGQALPVKVRGWLADLDRGDSASGSIAPLLIEEAGARVVVHFVPAREHGEPDALLLERAGELLTIPQLRAAGLTARQAEILRQVALGQTNAEIAAELEVSPRTVQKHLEHIYEQLGTRSRTEALLTAWSIAQLGP